MMCFCDRLLSELLLTRISVSVLGYKFSWLQEIVTELLHFLFKQDVFNHFEEKWGVWTIFPIFQLFLFYFLLVILSSLNNCTALKHLPLLFSWDVLTRPRYPFFFILLQLNLLLATTNKVIFYSTFSGAFIITNIEKSSFSTIFFTSLRF